MRLVGHTDLRRRGGAFTYLEAVVGVAIMAVMFVAFYTAISSAFSMIRVARENLRATQIMVNRLEGLRLYNWNQLIYSNWIPSTFTEYYYPLGTNGNAGITYSGQMTNSPCSLYPGATYDSTSMRAITVQVSWMSGGVQRTRQMSTYVARYGVQNYVYKN